MTEPKSVSDWIEGAKQGDADALQVLWEAYYPKLVRLARQRLPEGNRRMADEDDVANSVMKSFFRAAEAGRFPDLADRDDLWRLLMRMTLRKATDHYRRTQRAIHGGGKVRGESALEVDGVAGKIQAIDAQPTPDQVALLKEGLARLLALLEDPELQQIAVLKMERFENREIAQKLGCSEKTVKRRIKLIKEKWLRSEAAEST